VNQYFRHKVSIDDVVWAFSGIRSLYDDGSRKPEDVTRDYHLTLDEKRRVAPVLTIYGGKITTARKLAEAAFGRIGKFFQMHPPWTQHAALPGGDFAAEDFTVQVTRARNKWPFLSAETALRLVQAYGTRIDRVLGEATSFGDLGPRFVGDLTGAELRYLMTQEWAQGADDVLWRRTKLGLLASGQDREEIARFMADFLAAPA
jgi:glycerol-3-phosphate dehydrogenase